MKKSRKKLTIAAPRGFCAGVDRAVKIVEVAIEKYGPPVYVRHEIVHNKTVVDELSAKGAIFVEELDDVPTQSPVIFSAHGVARTVVNEAKRRNMIAIDATCPLVTKVHIEARRHAEKKRHILLIGHAGHPEVEGTMGQVSEDEITLVQTIDDAESVRPPDGSDLAFVTQTTLSVDDTAEIISVLQFRFPEISGPHGEDICYATTNRQKAVKDIAAAVDLMIIIGAENSSNSKRLVEVAKLAGAGKSILIADKDNIDWQLVESAEHIGLSAGASAPESLVKDVVSKLKERYHIDVNERGKIRETVSFKLPAIIAN